MEALLIMGLLLSLGFFIGSRLERQHIESLRCREAQTRHLKMFNVGRRQKLAPAESRLVVGSVVISSDYFKTFMGGLMQLIGGRIGVFESLLDRARREALLRMKEEALGWGATQVVNVRLESTELGGATGKLIAVEVVAYGTGIR